MPKKPVRLTGLFRTKKYRRLAVGTIKDDNLRDLARLLKKDDTKEHGLTVFVWKNDDEDGPAYTLSAAVGRPWKGKGKKSKAVPIDEDDDEDSDKEDTDEDDDSDEEGDSDDDDEEEEETEPEAEDLKWE